MPSRQQFLRSVVTGGAAAAAIVFGGAAQAQSYPGKPIRIVVPYAPSGASDTLARIIGQKMQAAWGQPVVVENKPGASGAIGVDYVAKQPADGHTLVISDLGTLTIGPSLYPNLPFNLERDLAPVGIVTYSPYLVTVHPGLPINSLKELIDYSKANPGKLNYASSGLGTNPHMAGLLFATRMGLKWEYIPNKGGAQAISDVMGGQADLMFNSAFSTSSHVKSGKLKLLAVSSPKRMAEFPNAPALAEVLPGFTGGGWQGLFVRAGTPPDIVRKLNAEINRILALPDVKDKLDALGAEPSPGTPESMARFLREDRERWARLVKELNFKIE